jgi:hypothetical protein
MESMFVSFSVDVIPCILMTIFIIKKVSVLSASLCPSMTTQGEAALMRVYDIL